MAYFAIYRLSDGELVSTETDAATQRLSDEELTERGMARTAVSGPLLTTEQWNPRTQQKEPLPPVPVDRDLEELKRLADKGGVDLTQQDRDDLLCLLAKRLI